jgi:hypothetical protein
MIVVVPFFALDLAQLKLHFFAQLGIKFGGSHPATTPGVQ